MKIAVITSSSSYEPRAEMAAFFFQSRGHQVTKIQSDFIHREKVKGREKKVDTIFIDTMPYYRNLSLKRLLSHYLFAKKVYDLIEDQFFDVVYVLIPANSLMKYMANYKEKSKSKLIVDIIDLWPESLPFRYFKKIWPVTIWSNMRNKYFDRADLVITECELYRNVLQEYLRNSNTSVIYWPKEYHEEVPEQSERDLKNVHLCYLGSINHIIDIKFIVKILKEIKKHKAVLLHIVGAGEKKEELLKQLETARIKYIYYGPVYDEIKKLKILTDCDYGLNIMKKSVCVGMTMKSVDYMYAGLPMINNIKGDIWDMIEQNKLGYNCDKSTLATVASKAIENIEQMRESRWLIHQFYVNMFSEKAYFDLMGRSVMQLLKDC